MRWFHSLWAERKLVDPALFGWVISLAEHRIEMTFAQRPAWMHSIGSEFSYYLWPVSHSTAIHRIPQILSLTEPVPILGRAHSNPRTCDTFDCSTADAIHRTFLLWEDNPLLWQIWNVSIGFDRRTTVCLYVCNSNLSSIACGGLRFAYSTASTTGIPWASKTALAPVSWGLRRPWTNQCFLNIKSPCCLNRVPVRRISLRDFFHGKKEIKKFTTKP